MQSRAIDRVRLGVAGLFSPSLVWAPFIRTSLMLLAVVGTTLLFTGCGPRRVRADYKAYENSFAVTSNHEELLNLARLEQHDPTYFFKLGQISSSYRMEASLTGAGQVSTLANPPASVIPTGGGTPLGLYENDPSFTLIPVTDDVNANILLKPIDSTVFYSLYLQGWRLDQLFRLTVNRIELTVPISLDSLPATDKNHKTGCKVEVIRNTPPPSFDADHGYVTDGPQLASYITFLRVSAVIYALQKHGLLLLRGTPAFEPVDEASFIPNGPSAPKKPEKNDTSAIDAAIKQANADNTPVSVSVTVAASTSGGGEAAKSASAPAAKDFNDAAAKNQEWQLKEVNTPAYKGDAWVLGANSIQPQFQLTAHPQQGSASASYASEDPNSYGQNVAAIQAQLESDFALDDNGMGEMSGGPDLTEILEILYNGFAIEESSTDQDAEQGLCAGTQHNRISAHLVMRSLIGLMAAAAQEQDSFDAMMDKPVKVPVDIGGIVMDVYSAAHMATTGNMPSQQEMAAKLGSLKSGAYINAVIPKIEQLPVLKLTWKDGKPPDEMQLAELGLTVKYRGRDYIVADSKQGLAGAEVPGNTYWNRDMFRLITELSSQVSVDISKFPLPEVLQLRTE